MIIAADIVLFICGALILRHLAEHIGDQRVLWHKGLHDPWFWADIVAAIALAYATTIKLIQWCTTWL